MKKIFPYSALLSISLFIAGLSRGQVFSVAPGTYMTIQAGTTFRADSLTLVPDTDFTISNNTLTKSTTIIHPSYNPYISRVYQFANNTGPFSGDVWIYYQDGAELNGIPENFLTLNIHNGTSWIYYPATDRNSVNNYVRSDNVIINSISELTLAHLSTPLPLSWLTFTATRQNQTALLKWSTAYEQNTKNFEVQHSINGNNWTDIGWTPAAGNRNTTSQYSFVHTTPVTGVNYYRIIQHDFNNRSSNSVVKTVLFSASDEPFLVIGNPVTNNILTVQVNRPTGLAFYTAEGKLLWEENVNAGTQTFDVSRYAKGTYFLQGGFTSKKVVIQ